MDAVPGEPAATRGRSPPATPGTFPLAVGAGVELVMGGVGPAGRASARLSHLFPQAGGGGERRGGTAENRLLRVGFFGRAASGAGPLGAPRMRSVGTAVPVPRLSLHHSWISGDGDRVHPAALGELPPLAPGFASSWAGICFWPVAPFARAGVCLRRTVPSCFIPAL